VWIPYARPRLTQSDIEAAVAVLNTPDIGQGKVTAVFEETLAAQSGLKHAIAVNTGTAALHLAYKAAGVVRGSKVALPGIQFVSAAAMAVQEGATLQLLEVDEETGNLDIHAFEQQLKRGLRTDVVCAVSYAGFPFNLKELISLSHTYGFRVIADQSHALGADFHVPADVEVLVTYSFQSLKHITAGEGGAVLTSNPEIANRLRALRNHGSTRDRWAPVTIYNPGDFYAQEAGFNYRITDFQSALLLSQLGRLNENISERRRLAALYLEHISGIDGITFDPNVLDLRHALHLFTVRAQQRDKLFTYLRGFGIGVQVHYVPLHHHPALKPHLEPGFSDSASAEMFFRSILSLPLFEGLTDDQVASVASKVRRFYATGCCGSTLD
jgi:dTDP-4-amino-4,6-dideoxygalactose transaminase